jgi:hypothetical protein
MRRRTLDALLTTGGLIVAAVLLAVGGLMTWASTFVDNEVHSQLSAQHITFPAKGSEQLNDPKVQPYLEQYAGQQLTTGAQAKAWADHYIKVHLDESTGGKTYSELSAAARANPDDPKAQAMVDLAFKGETLRGLLLNAYAFGTMGTIAMYAAWASFIGAAAMTVLALLGFMHLRRVPAEEEVGVASRRTSPQPAIA